MSTTVSKTLTYYLIQSYLKTPPPLMFSWEIYEKAVLKNFAVFPGKLQACNFIKNRLQHRVFFLNVVKFLRTPISNNIC